MAKLPAKEQEFIYKYLITELDVNDVEQWAYSDLAVEDNLSPDDYIELMSINYKRMVQDLNPLKS